MLNRIRIIPHRVEISKEIDETTQPPRPRWIAGTLVVTNQEGKVAATSLEVRDALVTTSWRPLCDRILGTPAYSLHSKAHLAETAQAAFVICASGSFIVRLSSTISHLVLSTGVTAVAV